MFKKNQYIWVCGYHSSIAALKNKNRKQKLLLITQNFYNKNITLLNQFQNSVNIKIVDKDKISELFPKNIAHQNIALYTSEISLTHIEQIIDNENQNSTILALDYVTDVGNIGAILRLSSAFEVDAVILTKQHSPDKSTISKVASGTLESVPLIHVNNLVNTIKYAQSNGYWCYGMDEHAEIPLHQTKFDKKTLIILGSEQSGLRELTKQNCDFIIKIPTSNKISSLNVANAAAITLYSVYLNLHT